MEGEIAREDMEKLLTGLNTEKGTVCFCSNGVSFSNMVGNSGRNRHYFENRYPGIRFRFGVDHTLPDMKFTAKTGDIK